MKIALITGVTGQDGSYLAELLLQKGYIVHGIRRRSSMLNTQRIDHLVFDKQWKDKFFLHYGDMTDGSNITRIIQPLRGEGFVTRKITICASQIANNKMEKMTLGNLDAQRDWGHAKDYVEGMWRMMQQETPEDYVLATGITTSVREFARLAFAEAGIEIAFTGEGENEKAQVVKCNNPKYQLPEGKIVIEIDPKYYRPTEVELLVGDASKALNQLGWKPTYKLAELIKEMMGADLEAAEG